MVSDASGAWGAINHENELIYPFKYGWEELYDILYKSSDKENFGRDEGEQTCLCRDRLV